MEKVIIDKRVDHIFKEALRFAKKRRHDYLTVEHILLVLLNDKEGEKIVEKSGIDVTALKRSIGRYMESTVKFLPENVVREPFETVAVSRVIDNMIRRVRSAGKREAGVNDLLAAIIDEKGLRGDHLLEERDM